MKSNDEKVNLRRFIKYGRISTGQMDLKYH